MSRLVALTVVISLTSSFTFAGEGLMQSGTRIVQQQVTQDAHSAPAVSVAVSKPSLKPAGFSASSPAAMQEGPAVLSRSGMSKRTKVMIYLAAGVGLAGTAWAIDHHVLDVTPSSLGTRRDGCKPFCGGSQ